MTFRQENVVSASQQTFIRMVAHTQKVFFIVLLHLLHTRRNAAALTLLAHDAVFRHTIPLLGLQQNLPVVTYVAFENQLNKNRPRLLFSAYAFQQ